jgi:hypothetical protein
MDIDKLLDRRFNCAGFPPKLAGARGGHTGAVALTHDEGTRS